MSWSCVACSCSCGLSSAEPSRSMTRLSSLRRYERPTEGSPRSLLEPSLVPRRRRVEAANSCSDCVRKVRGHMRFAWDFREGEQLWEAGFSDLPVQPDVDFELTAGVRPLPPGIAPAGTGFMLHGSNRSDCLFMFLRRQLTAADGLEVGAAYDVELEVRFASNSPTGGAAGAGGRPGESVSLKVGAGAAKPTVIHDDAEPPFLRMSVDIGRQANGGNYARRGGKHRERRARS